MTRDVDIAPKYSIPSISWRVIYFDVIQSFQITLPSQTCRYLHSRKSPRNVRINLISDHGFWFHINVAFDGEMLDRITQTIERFSTRLIETERTLRTEMDKKWADELQRREDHIRQNYNQERLNYEKELMDLKVSPTHA
jgi:hypothetical protein